MNTRIDRMTTLSIPASSLSMLDKQSTKLVAKKIFDRFNGIEIPTNYAMQHGINTEPVVIDLLKSKHNIKGSKVPSKTTKYNDMYLSATPDFLDSDGYLYEVKCPYYIRRIISEDERKNDVFNELKYVKTLEEYYKTYEIQCMFQMYCYKIYKHIFVIYLNDELHFRPVEYDESIIDNLKPKLDEIWDYLIEMRTNQAIEKSFAHI